MTKTTWIIIGVTAGVVVLGLLVYLLFHAVNSTTSPGGQAVTLQFWGVYDDVSFYSQTINAYRQLHPNVQISYRQLPAADYERMLIDAFAAGNGPDIWLLHNTWLAKHGDLITPLPTTPLAGQSNPLFTIKTFQDQFVDVAVADLASGGRIYALPLYVDTLALYYNKAMFNSAGLATPPATWDEFNNAVKKLTVIDKRGNLGRAGAAIGTARNVNRSTDLLALLMLQSGVQMTSADHSIATFAEPIESQPVGETALQYYTDFANPSKTLYTWNDQQHYSLDAFLEGNVAMLFNYSHQLPLLRQRAARFDFGIAAMPQIAPTGTAGPQAGSPAVNYANYWAPTVWKGSQHAAAAWQFLAYLASADGASKYLNASGRPAARRDLLTPQQSDPDLGVFARQALSARDWYQPDSTQVEQIFADLIDDVNYGRASIHDALRAAEDKVNMLLRR